MADDIRLEVGDSGIAWLVFDRPEARNAMTFAMYDRLGELCRSLPPSVRVLLLRGAGNKAFVSGTDISQFRAFSKPQDAVDYEARMDRVFDALEDVPVPTMAVIQGACTGGGAAIAAACDLRIGAPSARFGFPIARTLGNTLSMRNHARLAALVGVARVKELVFFARLLDADQMLACGLLTEIASEDGLYARAEELARGLLEHAPLTLRGTKEALHRILRAQVPEGGEDLVKRSYSSDDFREGVESFLAKRKPAWKGR